MRAVEAPAPPQTILNMPVKRDLNVSTMLSPAVGALVSDLAAGLEPMTVIMQRYGLSKQQMKGLLNNEVFRAALVEAKSAFSSTSNADDRIKLKAKLAVELLMDDMATIAGHPAHPPSARVMAFNAIKNLTGLEKPEPQPQKQRFNLTINLPPAGPNAEPEQITIEAEADAAVEPSYDADRGHDDGGDDGVGDNADTHELVPIPTAAPSHDKFRNGAQGYVPRMDQAGTPVSIITNRPL